MTQPKERPIIFNAEEVRAILEGRKTMTRQVMAVQPNNNNSRILKLLATSKKYRKNIGKFLWEDSKGSIKNEKYFPCPYGAYGDRLWVREEWFKNDYQNSKNYGGIGYRSSYIDCIYTDLIAWGSPASMPRDASRINLEITGLKVERLQDITEEDAKKEGVFNCSKSFEEPLYTWDEEYGILATTIRNSFMYLWDGINGKKESKRWNANPWVWVIEFKRVK